MKTDIQLVQNAVSLFGVTVFSIEDILYMGIRKWMAYAFMASGLLMSLILRSPMETALSALPGLILLILGLVTKEKIGYGDAATAIGLGLWAGSKAAVWCVLFGLGLSSVVSIIYMAYIKIKGLSGKKTIPFIPFLLFGLVVSIVSV